MLNGLDLFSGIGGIAEALHPWVRTVAYCENDSYATAVLLSRMSHGEIDMAPVWDDVTTLKGKDLPDIDIISGGFPCQDISIAGAGKGLEGERSGLFGEIVRLSSEVRPQYIFLENVPAITFRGLSTVAAEISRLRYDCRWGLLSAYDVGAPHKRERWWLLANARGVGRDGGEQVGVRPKSNQPKREDADNTSQVRPGRKDVANTAGDRRRGERQTSEVEKGLQPRPGRARELEGGSERRGSDVPDTDSRGLEGASAGRRQAPENVKRRGGERSEDVANADKQRSQGREREVVRKRAGQRVAGEGRPHAGNAPDPNRQGLEKCHGRRMGQQEKLPKPKQARGQRFRGVEEDGRAPWTAEPNVGRVVNGLPFRSNRLMCLGNSVVPQCAREAFKRLMGLDSE